MTGNNFPMMPVQDAIRVVLYQTALALMDSKTPSLRLKTLSVHSPWSELLDQTIATEVRMPEPGYPPYNASIMDGYAIRAKEAISDKQGQWSHGIQAKVFAGDSVDKIGQASSQPSELPPAYYVTTGAIVPDTFDCVVPIEECKLSEDGKYLAFASTAITEEGQWIRQVGCDTPSGSVVLQQGHVLDPPAIGLLLQLGFSTIQIRDSVKAGVLSTGNELLQPCEEPKPGCIPDVNRPILLSLLSTFGPWCVPVDLGIQRDDDIPQLTQCLKSALEECDVIISTGGISMGESDVMEQVLVEQLGGTIHFGRLHMKPGKPTTFVTFPGHRLVFAMPGNPVSATVCTHLLVRPCLHLLYNGPDQSADIHGESMEEEICQRTVDNAWVHPEVAATLTHSAKLDKQRPEYHRVTLALTKDGKYEATTTGVQRSSRLMSMRDAHGLLLLPQGVPGAKMEAAKGEEYTVLLLKDDQFRRVQVRDSLHLNKKAHKSVRIAIIQVLGASPVPGTFELAEIADLVRRALSGTSSGPATIISSRAFDGRPEELFDFVAKEDNVDVHVVVCASYPGSFRRHLDISNELVKRLEKVADGLALQVRRGAASEDATSAYFETVAGYVPNGRGAMLVCVSDHGLVGGLQNVRGLLKHALQVARSKSQGAHHSHALGDHHV